MEPAADDYLTDRASVYLLRNDRLVPAERRGESPEEALDRLVDGPTAEERAVGIGTALPLQRLRLAPPRSSELAVIEVPDGFTALTSRTQFLATAQMVWTVTGICCASRVRPVHRADYASVAPQ